MVCYIGCHKRHVRNLHWIDGIEFVSLPEIIICHCHGSIAKPHRGLLECVGALLTMDSSETNHMTEVPPERPLACHSEPTKARVVPLYNGHP